MFIYQEGRKAVQARDMRLSPSIPHSGHTCGRHPDRPPQRFRFYVMMKTIVTSGAAVNRDKAVQFSHRFRFHGQVPRP